MILERLCVEGFRNLTAPVELVPDERLTIISAPNGTGKSTLLDALYFGLLEKHTVMGAAATERFASRGRALVPRIVIDFCVGQTRYRLRKHFLSERMSRLERYETTRFVPLHEGAAADDFVRELLAADAPVRGTLDAAKHWGLGHILWSPSNVRYGPLPLTAGDQIRALLTNAATATLGERGVQERVAQRYQRYFTSSGEAARAATSANLPAREAAINVAQTAVDQATAAVKRLDDLRRSHEDSDWQAQRLAAKRVELRAQSKEMKLLALHFDELTAQRRICAQDEERWGEQSADVKRRIDAIAVVRARIAEVAVRREFVRSEVEALSQRLAASTDRIRDLVREVDCAAATCVAVQQRAASITMAQAYVSDIEELRRLRDRIALTDADNSVIADLVNHRAGIVAPAKSELKILRQCDDERRTLEAKISASALTLEFMPDGDARLNIVVGEHTSAPDTAGGQGAVVTGTDQIVVVIPGVGRVRASAADSTAAARRKHAPLAAKVSTTLQQFAATSVAELETRSERVTDLDNHIEMRRRLLAERLGNEEPVPDRQRLATTQSRVDAIELLQPSWRGDPPAAFALRTAFDHELRESADAQSAARLSLQAAQLPHDAMRTELDRLHMTGQTLANEEQQQLFKLTDLEADGRDDAARESALLRCSLEWHAQRAQGAQLDKQLNEFAENPHACLATLEAQELDAGRQYEDRHGQAQRDLALLEEFAQHGSYCQLAEAEEKLADLTEQMRSERAEAAAIRLLSTLFADVRQQRIAAVLTPIETSASGFLARIAGPSLSAVKVSANLTPRGVWHHPTDELVDIESTLSAGEREQTYIATRLAIADVIAGKNGRQLFILDDVLTASDPGRLRRFVTLLEELSRERLQIIITTADPSRYLGVVGAKHIDLREALAIASAA